MNRSIFEKPFEFLPDRWLNNDKILEKYLIPFSIGKRFCIGKHMTKDLVFIFTIMILRRLNFSINDDMKTTNENEMRTFGLSRNLKPLDINVGFA